MDIPWTSVPAQRAGPPPTTTIPPIRDLWLRLLLSPVFGITLPLLTGLVSPDRHSPRSLASSAVTFSLIAFLVWEGNRRLHYRLSRREDWLRRPWHRVGVLLGVIVGVTIPVSTLLLLAWQRLFDDPGLSPRALPATVVAIVSLVAVITTIYETVFVLREWETDRIRAAEGEAARLAATLERLSRDVGPHFLFNNLSALQHLVERGDPRAATFVDALSETYRYVLQTHDRPLVPLSDELHALELQRVLVSERYCGQVVTHVDVDAGAASQWLVPPASLGELLINAAKHSRVDAGHPLVLRVALDGDMLRVDNAVTRPSTPPASTGTGLWNLAARARLCTGRPASWALEGERFVVRVPLVAR
jgi:hypothetical protein